MASLRFSVFKAHDWVCGEETDGCADLGRFATLTATASWCQLPVDTWPAPPGSPFNVRSSGSYLSAWGACCVSDETSPKYLNIQTETVLRKERLSQEKGGKGTERGQAW